VTAGKQKEVQSLVMQMSNKGLFSQNQDTLYLASGRQQMLEEGRANVTHKGAA
jgi:hypothetical protein